MGNPYQGFITACEEAVGVAERRSGTHQNSEQNNGRGKRGGEDGPEKGGNQKSDGYHYLQ